MAFLGQGHMAHSFVVRINLRSIDRTTLNSLEEHYPANQSLQAHLRIIQTYLEVASICDVVKVLNALLLRKFTKNIHIPVCPLVRSENVVVWNEYNSILIPNLEHSMKSFVTRGSGM